MAGNPYTILGVQEDATQDQIRSAYRKLAKKYHPDLNPGNAEAEKKFKELNTANDILSSPEKRVQFDKGEIDETGAPKHHYSQGHQESWSDANASSQRGPFYYQTQQDGGRYSSAFGDMHSSFFEELFGHRGGSRSEDSGSSYSAFGSNDEHYRLEVSFKDAALGAEREITLPSGKNIKVKIPAGIDSGKQIRLKGAAGGDTKNVPPGDVYIEISVKSSKRFSRSGKTIELSLPITISEAILGGEVKVPTLENPVMLKIPPATKSGAKLRVKGKGVGGQEDRGDLIVTVEVVLPEVIDPELHEAISVWSKTHSYNPRANLDKQEDDS